MSTNQNSRLAELLDSRSDTRDMLSACPNLAHACLLLERGEFELARRELLLGLKEDALDAQVIGRCIEAELLRAEGKPTEAWQRALECAQENRFHSAAVLYLRLLFSLAGPSPVSEDAAREDDDSQAPVSAPEPVSVLEPQLDDSSEGCFPGTWKPILEESGTVGLRLGTPQGNAVHGCDLAPLVPLLDWLATDLFPRAGMGDLQHAAFEGAQRALHHWYQHPALTALLEAGQRSPVLAARLSKAHREWEEEA
jgi:hypothetical protein